MITDTEMNRALHIFFALALSLATGAGCTRNLAFEPAPAAPSSDIKVPITLNVQVPLDRPATKAMADKPQINNMVVAVFGGSGYFNEWVPVRESSQMATENYNEEGNFAIYQVKFDLSLSESRLRLHFIANCPSELVNNPPITGVTSQDLEDVVMSKVRSKLSETNSDGYWAKILLPYGVQMEMEEEPNTHELVPVKIDGGYVPSSVTKAQIDRYNKIGGIPMVRNFARVYLDNLTSEWTVQSFCFAYAPAEGPIAPILTAPITTDEWGDRVVVQYASETDETGTVYPIQRYTQAEAPHTVRELTDTDGNDLLGAAADGSTIYTESFFINYQNYPLTTGEGENYRKISDAPLNYGGYSPADLALGTYPSDDSGMTAWSATTPLYIYERAKPTASQKATRIIVKAYKTTAGESTAKYYPLDLVDGSGVPMFFLRNFTYNIQLTGISEGSGYDTIAEAADATSANVASDPRTADLNEVSDGASLIAVSYIDATYIQKGDYSLMFHYEQPIGTERNNTVTLQIGYGTGYDFVAGSVAGNGSAFSGTPQIVKNNGSVVQYVRNGNDWVEATAAQIADSSIEKWGMITYTTAQVDRNGAAATNDAGYYTKGFSQTIRVYGGNNTIFRDVLINLTPLKDMTVECLDKYIDEGKDVQETVRVYIPDDLTRSMFPMTFKVEFADNTLNPVAGANMPVQSGKSIVPDKGTQSAFFFIRTLTRDEYNALPTAADGRKYFDCSFKTIEAHSETTVYVYNEYFNLAWDEFYNFIQRQFTAAPPGNLSIEQELEYRFYMDNAHSGVVVWNDAEEIDYSSDRIIPHTVLITMNGISPKVESVDGGVITYVDSPYLERVSGNVYKLTVAMSGNDPAWTDYTLHLVAGSEDEYSITLSTSGNTPNPSIYADYTVSGLIEMQHIRDARFTNTSGSTISSVKTDAGLQVQFRFSYDQSLVPVTFKLQGLVPVADSRISGPDASGVYTFTPAAGDSSGVIISFTTEASTECRLYDFAINDLNYAQPDPDAFSLERSDRRWVTDSYTITFDGNNYNTTSFTTSPQNVVFTNTEGNNWTYYKLMGTRTLSGPRYNYYNGSFTVTAPSSLTDSRITGIDLSYYDTYNQRSVTVAGNVSSSSTLAGNKNSWTSSSTEDGNGDSTVTVTMSCTSDSEYRNRNRLTGITVYYGYWSED